MQCRQVIAARPNNSCMRPLGTSNPNVCRVSRSWHRVGAVHSLVRMVEHANGTWARQAVPIALSGLDLLLLFQTVSAQSRGAHAPNLPSTTGRNLGIMPRSHLEVSPPLSHMLGYVIVTFKHKQPRCCRYHRTIRFIERGENRIQRTVQFFTAL